MDPIHPSCSRHKDDLCFMGPEMCGQLPGTTLCVARWAAPSVAKRPRAPPPMPPPEGCVGRPRRGAAVPKTGFAGAPRSAPVDLSTHQITPKQGKSKMLKTQEIANPSRIFGFCIFHLRQELFMLQCTAVKSSTAQNFLQLNPHAT